MEKTFVEILKETKESINKAETLTRFEYCGTQAGCHCAVGHVFVNAGLDMKMFEDEGTNGDRVGSVLNGDLYDKFESHMSFLETIQSLNDDRTLDLDARKKYITSEIDEYITKLEEK